MVVQAVLPPLRNELADHDGDEVGPFGLEGIDLLEERDTQLPVGRGDDIEWHRNVVFCPRGLEGLRVLVMLGDVHRAHAVGTEQPSDAQGVTRTAVQRRDRDERNVLAWSARRSDVGADGGDVHHDHPALEQQVPP